MIKRESYWRIGTDLQPQRIGIFGGAFDPFHLGHLAIVQAGLDQLNLDQLLLVPTYHPAHKSPCLLSFDQRLIILNQLRPLSEKIVISPIEADLAQPSYSLQTLEALSAGFGFEHEFLFFVGTDSLNSLSSWHKWQKLSEICQFVVFQRGQQEAKPPVLPQSAIFVETSIPEVSSSEIRQRLRQGLPIMDLVPSCLAELTHRYLLETLE